MTTGAGPSVLGVEVADRRDRIDLEYRNRGYESVVVEPDGRVCRQRHPGRRHLRRSPRARRSSSTTSSSSATSGRARETIERELLLRRASRSATARIESQQRLTALGLFRRVVIDDLRHAGEPRARRARFRSRRRRRPRSATAAASKAARGCGRRATAARPRSASSWRRAASSRSAGATCGARTERSICSRASASARATSSCRRAACASTQPAEGSGYGFNEYRVVGTFREPRVFNTPADVLVTGIVEQAIRSSFNFSTARSARPKRACAVGRATASPAATRSSRRSCSTSASPRREAAHRPAVSASAAVEALRLVHPRHARRRRSIRTRGTFFIVDTDVAARALGSEVGFVKTFLQGFRTTALPMSARTVVALGARLGAAHGFRRTVTAGPDGSRPRTGRQDDRRRRPGPAGERAVLRRRRHDRARLLARSAGQRGRRSAHRLSPGGNGVIVLNAELRVTRRAAVCGPSASSTPATCSRARAI